MRDIGKNIRYLRESKGLTQDQLAEKLFVTRQTVSNYETGRTRPDVDMIVSIANVLRTSGRQEKTKCFENNCESKHNGGMYCGFCNGTASSTDRHV